MKLSNLAWWKLHAVCCLILMVFGTFTIQQNWGGVILIIIPSLIMLLFDINHCLNLKEKHVCVEVRS